MIRLEATFSPDTFQILTNDHIPQIRDFFSRYPQVHCDYNIATLIPWQPIVEYSWRVLEGRLILYSNFFDYIYMPVGEILPGEILIEISQRFRQRGKKGRFILVSEDHIQANPGLTSWFEVVSDMDNADYIYDSQALVDLKGKKLQKKKNLINQFIQANPHVLTRPFQKEDVFLCLELIKKWCKNRDCWDLELQRELIALERALLFANIIGIEGIIIQSEGIIEAFCLYNHQTSDMITVHFEKYNPELKGISQYLNREMARWASERGVKWINREQDMGLEGLRQAKQSYSPHHQVITYQLHPIVS